MVIAKYFQNKNSFFPPKTLSVIFSVKTNGGRRENKIISRLGGDKIEKTPICPDELCFPLNLLLCVAPRRKLKTQFREMANWILAKKSLIFKVISDAAKNFRIIPTS